MLGYSSNRQGKLTKVTIFCLLFSHLQRKSCPEEHATFLSRITWWWQNGQIWHGWRRPLKYDDLVDLNTYDKSEAIAPVFQKHWNKELCKAG